MGELGRLSTENVDTEQIWQQLVLRVRQAVSPPGGVRGPRSHSGPCATEPSRHDVPDAARGPPRAQP